MLCTQVPEHAHIYVCIHTHTYIHTDICLLYIHISIQIVRAHIQKLYPNIWRRVKEAVQSNLLSPKNVLSLLHFKEVGSIMTIVGNAAQLTSSFIKITRKIKC